jgi:tetratricopeptide (TPR) repeat protein
MSFIRDSIFPIPTVALVLIALLQLGGCASWTPTQDETAAGKPAAVKPAKAEPAINPESRRLYEQALAALQAGRTPEAERGLLAVASREPALAGPHANLGLLYARTNRATQAIASLQQAIRLNPERAAYHNELGLLYRREGKFDQARDSYAKALEADPNYANAHLNIGILYDLYLQDLEKAMQHYQRYRELAPSEAATVAKWLVDLQQRGRAADKSKGGKSG